MCAHVLGKAGRVLKRPEWSMQVPQTFEALGGGLRRVNDSVEISIHGQRLQVWDEIHESSLNYPHSVFAPMNLVTVLRYLSESTSPTNIQYYSLVDYFTNWMLDHTAGDLGKGGMLASPHMNAPTIWSTAAGIITLSRVIRNRHLIARLESHLQIETESKMRGIPEGNEQGSREPDLKAPLTPGGQKLPEQSKSVESLSPLSLLNTAIQAVPSVRYALGLSGVAAAGAIITSLVSGYTFMTPVTVGLVFLGMVVLILVSIVAAATVSKSSFFAGQVLLWAVTIFVVASLGLTISALAIGVPCHWNELLTHRPDCS
jgi:hypothetical protein